MIRAITIILALVGLGAGIWVAATSKQKLPSPPPAQPPSVNPYPSGIAALGFVEGTSREVEVGAPQAGLVVRVLVEPTQVVHEGDVLFELDDRDLQADLVSARAATARAEADLARLESMPRAEDLVPARAKVTEAEAWLADAERKYQNTIEAEQKRAATAEEVEQRRWARDAAKAVAEGARAELERIEAGAWEADKTVARAEIERLRANVRAVEMRLEQLKVRALADGTVLRRIIEPGEYLSPGANPAPLVLADLSRLFVRAQVDEEDMPLLREGAEAVARVRGPVAEMVPLRMVRIEPFARRKNQISGSNTELIDTRVIDVLFEVLPREDAGATRLLPGQALDVFIRATNEPGSGPAPPRAGP
ncbi:MAG: efflux RND transporter periplasmic adaptor subunit [Phycisphaerales bacterium]|nr:efflux RND transporter periplasmic adaptor subunit [Phycisphaerales bacterium]